MRSIFPALTIGMLLAVPLAAGEDGLSGHWKFSISEQGQQISLWLLHLESKDGKLTAAVDSLKGAPKARVEEVKMVGDTLSIKLRASIPGAGGAQEIHFDYEGKLPKPGAKKILGSLTQGRSLVPAILEATSAKNSFEMDREILLRTPSDPRALQAILDVIEQANSNKVTVKDLQEMVENSIRIAEQYGPRMQMKHQTRLLEALQPQKMYSAIAIDTARKIGKQMDPRTPMDTQLAVLTMIADVLRKGDQKEEALALETRLEKLEGQAYTDYSKTALGYKTEKFAGRKGKSNRAILIELFTGAQCPPCVAADMAFDGVEKTYGPGEVVLLQYHMHIPRPEPMSNADADARFEFYAANHAKQVRGTPASLFNGRPEVMGGGDRDDAVEKYKDYCDALNKLLETPAAVKLSAVASRQGNKVTVQAKVEELAQPGDKVRLRFVLVEDWVRFKGGNGLQYHHRVVRALPGGVKGFALAEKSSEHKASLDLEELRKNLNTYLDEDYKEGPRPMRLRNLSVVAFVQNDESTEVLQAVNVALKDE